jgi:dihydroxyacetone kinase-like protein
MINGPGGTPISELYLLYRYALNQLVDRSITITRNYVGSPNETSS